MKRKTITKKTPDGANQITDKLTRDERIEKVEKKIKEFTKIQGILTSNLRTRKSSDTPYMAFIRQLDDNFHSQTECEASKCKSCEIPVVFRIKECDYNCSAVKCKIPQCQCQKTKPNLKKSDSVILEGEFANSQKSSRPSFTCYSYQILKDHE